ncbi:hypothetical protein M3221_18545 [Domibacillus indicus]|uniref:hypothetical protein n=1 Tax=Domibacillus indicus TaxID=1437523 RepID=UPI0020407DC9|nr:hypothetical protein [Domibacillus indicus]MCM3790378.1 hypothetical protein [Domibacillus indicus]
MGKIFKFGCLGIIGIIIILIILAVVADNEMEDIEVTTTKEDAAPASTEGITKTADKTEGLTQEKFNKLISAVVLFSTSASPVS